VVLLCSHLGLGQQAPTFAFELDPGNPTARSDTQIWSSIGAIIGTVIAALVADWLGRRITYSLLCLGR